MAYNNPVPFHRLVETLDLVGLQPGDFVLDVGCGTGELLRTLGRRNIEGLGIDTDAAALEEARTKSMGLPVAFHCADAKEAVLPAHCSLSLCIGSTHAFGGGMLALSNALPVLAETVREGGHVVIGEGFHRQELPEPYRRLFGAPTGIERTHFSNVEECERHGFRVVHAISASKADWDAFEWGFYRRRLRKIEGMEEGDEQERARQQALEWRDGYLQWGRNTMGFGLYLLQKV